MKTFVLFILIIPLVAISQNLVPNPSFEIHTSCPNGVGAIYKLFPWTDPTSASSDFFDSCSIQPMYSGVPSNICGFQNARTGHGYIGFALYVKNVVDDREYVQVPLLDTLKNGVNYLVKFYINLANIEKYAVDAMGAYFSKTAVTTCSSHCVLNYTPQVSNPVGNFITDTLNWTEISGSFIATGGEKYLTIGNFKNDSATNILIVDSNAVDVGGYYYLDDVSVIQDTVTGIKESPISTKSSNEFSLFPNPTSNNIELLYNINENAKFILFDLYGKVLKNIELNPENTKKRLSLIDLSDGVYVYKILINNKLIKTDKLVLIK